MRLNKIILIILILGNMNISNSQTLNKPLSYNNDIIEKYKWLGIDSIINYSIQKYIEIAEPFAGEIGVLVIRFIKLDSQEIKLSIGYFHEKQDIGLYYPYSHCFYYNNHPVLIKEPVLSEEDFRSNIDAFLHYKKFKKDFFEKDNNFLCKNAMISADEYNYGYIEYAKKEIKIIIYNEYNIPSNLSPKNW